MSFERHIFTVTAAVTLDRAEADLDHHYVLRVGRQTMIAEAPSSLCTWGATAISTARSLGTSSPALVTRGL